MKKIIWRGPILSFLAALSFAGCESLQKIKPAPMPIPPPVSSKISAQDKKAAAAAPWTTRPLFLIERSKNANVVHYDASFGADGKLAPGEPVVAYWVMLAKDGGRKKLNWLEKKKAYGIRIKPDLPGKGYTLTLAAAPWLPLSIKKAGDTTRAEVAINGRPAVLEKMFIQTHDRLIGPKVDYIELYGKDLQTGEACREKIVPK